MKRSLPILAALCALFVLITASPSVIRSASQGLRLCGELLVPALFPFLVLSLLLAKLGFSQTLGRRLSPVTRQLFGVSGTGVTAFFIGLSGGYPLGAAYLAELTEQGLISPREAERLLGFCNNSGPSFLVGAIGAGVFGSVRAGLLLYISHALAAVLTGLLLRGAGAPAEREDLPSPDDPPSFALALTEAVRGAVPAILSICAFVILFTVFTGLLDANGFLAVLGSGLSALSGLSLPQSRALLLGFWELGGGAGALRGLALNPGNLALAAGLVGWGGVSVHMQSLAPFSSLPVRCRLHLPARLLSAALGAGLTYLLALLFL